MVENRVRDLRQRYDLIIIGGGIHGATLAWEATSRGLQILLLEQNDFASSTSANSLKVIHGGIRYLQDLDFVRMRSSIRERKILHLFQELLKPAAGKTQARACNILIRRKLTDCALGFKAKPPDGGTGNQTSSRLLFIAPWRDGSLIGTWYYADSASPAEIKVSRQELQAAVKEIDSVLPSLRLSVEDISFVHCGLLPIIDTNEGQGEPLLQKHFQVINAQQTGGPAGLFWIQGVKYTTARAIADYTLQQLTKQSGKSLKPAISHKTPLYGGQSSTLPPHRLPAATVRRLLNNYGSCTTQIMCYIEQQPALSEPIPGVADSIQAELHFVLDQEMVYTLSDLLLRRTDIGSLTQPASESIDFCRELMTRRFAWTSDQQQMNINALLDRYPDYSR